MPVEVGAALTGARLTALAKPDGGARRIAMGCSLRRLVARTLAKQFPAEFEKECAPFQHALSTRARTDCVGHILRAVTDADHSATIVSDDGIGAYHHVLRGATLERLLRMPAARAILSFVRISYTSPSSCSWWDDEGIRHNVTQAEGGEQSDSLVPLLFFIAIQGALEEVATMLLPGEHLCAFLDDVYTLCSPDWVKPIYEALQASVCIKARPEAGMRQASSRKTLALWEKTCGSLAELGSWHPHWARAFHKRQVARQSGGGAEVVGSNPENA